jgi:hypothetical protein
VDQVGLAFGQGQAGQGAHRLGQHDHLVDPQVPTEEFDELDGVGDPAVEGHLAAADLAVAPEGLARPAVVPLHHREVPLPGPQGQGEDRVGPAGPAVQDQQHGVVAVLAPDLEPLVNPADLDEPLLDDPVRGVDLERVGGPALAGLAPGQAPDHGHGDEGRHAGQNGSDHLCSPLHPSETNRLVSSCARIHP